MRHRKTGRQFSRNSSHRRAMLRALTANLVAHERIETTESKAKELRRVAERMITRARRLGEVAYTPHDKLSLADRARRHAAQRQMARFLRRFAVVGQGDDERKIDLVEKVFVDLAKRFKDRSGGYTRMLKLGHRRGDNAPMTLIEFVDRPNGGGAPARKEPAPKAAAEQAEPAKAEAKKAEAKKVEAKKVEAKKVEAPSEAAAEAQPNKKAAKKKAAAKAEGGEAEKPAKAEPKPKAKAPSKAKPKADKED
jgi:large subunit ribosomal protein L17